MVGLERSESYCKERSKGTGTRCVGEGGLEQGWLKMGLRERLYAERRASSLLVVRRNREDPIRRQVVLVLLGNFKTIF